MINMPKDYANIPINNFEPAEAGGHKATIMRVDETTSKNGLQMLVIYFDFDENDKQPNYYMKKFEADKKSPDREEKWRGVMYLVVDQGTNYGPSNLKRFVTAVEDSNPGFQVAWGQNFCGCLAGRKVGIVFRIEEYIQSDHQLGAAAKPFRFCAYDKAFEQKIPNRKCLPENEKPQTAAVPPFGQMSFGNPAPAANPAAAAEGFMNTQYDPVNDEGLPFG